VLQLEIPLRVSAPPSPARPRERSIHEYLAIGPQPHRGFVEVFGDAALDDGDGAMEGAWENGTEVTHMTSVAINDQRPKRALSDAQLAELASPTTLVGAMRRARQEGRFVTCSNRIAGPVAVITASSCTRPGP
jgi:hypothetical protein